MEWVLKVTGLNMFKTIPVQHADGHLCGLRENKIRYRNALAHHSKMRKLA